MKPKLITAILLFVSAYAPLFLILAVKDWDFKCLNYFKHPVAIYIMLGLSALSVILLFVTVHSLKGGMVVKVKAVKNRSADLINYTIPYIVSFFSFDLSKMGDVISLSIFLLLMLFLTIKSKSVFLNPILLLAGYNLYDLDFIYDKKEDYRIILSKEEPRSGEQFQIKSLTRFLYITTKKITTNVDKNKIP
jgi:hypothetical protein